MRQSRVSANSEVLSTSIRATGWDRRDDPLDQLRQPGVDDGLGEPSAARAHGSGSPTTASISERSPMQLSHRPALPPLGVGSHMRRSKMQTLQS